MTTIIIMIAGTIAMWVLALWAIRNDLLFQEDWIRCALLFSCAMMTVLVIFVLVVVFSSPASAAENSAPAESALTVAIASYR